MLKNEHHIFICISQIPDLCPVQQLPRLAFLVLNVSTQQTQFEYLIINYNSVGNVLVRNVSNQQLAPTYVLLDITPMFNV
jgi:hypothetical protein